MKIRTKTRTLKTFRVKKYSAAAYSVVLFRKPTFDYSKIIYNALYTEFLNLLSQCK